MEKGTIFRRKRFNLHGPDGLKYYFHDTRKQTMSAIRRQIRRRQRDGLGRHRLFRQDK